MTDLIGVSAAMRETLAAALDVAGTSTTVLVTGESGAGKELLARLVHGASPRTALPFTLLSCVTLDAAAAEAALAHGGTVVLDEVAALSFEDQGRLLLLLEKPRSARVIGISNRDLPTLVLRGTLRADLYYRLDVFPLRMPALRERREDLVPLADLLLRQHALRLGRPALRLSGGALSALAAHAFPGNVRELGNVLERAAIRARAPVIEAAELGLGPALADTSQFPSALPLELSQLERLAIAEALRRSGGNRTHAARLLGLGLRTLRQKLNGPVARGGSSSRDLEAQLQEAS